jgi:glycosyltransferase involved in cell wall biosynthesis
MLLLEEDKKQQVVLFGNLKINYYIKIMKQVKKNKLYHTINDVPENFLFIFVGHWINGDLGEDRKNVGLLVKAFFETFKNKQNKQNKPALILKTSQAGASYIDREEILKKIKKIAKTVNSKNLPNVYLLHGEFTDEEMNEIYNHPKVKAMVSLTKGEGFGRPLLEFTLAKKPLICSGWSGQMDFLESKYTCLVGGNLTNVHPSAANQWLIPESQWFSPDHTQVGFYLKDVFENYKNYTDNAKKQANKSKNEFSWEKMKEKTDELLAKYIPEFPKEVKLELPKLNKIEIPKLKKLEVNG